MTECSSPPFSPASSIAAADARLRAGCSVLKAGDSQLYVLTATSFLPTTFPQLTLALSIRGTVPLATSTRRVSR